MKKMIGTVLKAITLAMGVAVVVLSALNSIDTTTAITLLGIGLASGGIALMNDNKS